MDYPIYTFGSGDILSSIFNALALLCRSDNEYMTSLGQLTATLGLLAIIWRALPKGQIPLLMREWFIPFVLLTNLTYAPKVSVKIIDIVDQNAFYKVDHIPFGVAAVASLATTFSKTLTQMVEDVLCPQTGAARYSTSGPLFGTRLAAMAKEMRIRDPLMRENIKDYVRQCFMWPFVFSNIEPGKKAALDSEDILTFIETHPHPLLGLYWRQPDGQTQYISCQRCTVKVREAMQVEVNNGISDLAQKVFGKVSSHSSQQITNRLRLSFEEGWQAISRKTAEASYIIQQELMINAYREAFSDKRDELGLGRLDSDLIRANGMRAQNQQNASILVSATKALEDLPMYHTVFMALVVMLFLFIVPLSFLPRGSKMLLQWVRLVVWLSMWPLLFSILDGLGHLYAAKAVAGSMVGYGNGLTLLTQSLISDSAYDAYCLITSLQVSVPFLSWAFVSGGGYALSQVAGSFTKGVEGAGSKFGSEMVDGTISFDTQTLHHRSVANRQLAQQNFGAFLNSGSRLDDGKMSTIYSSSGQLTAQEHLTSLGTNVQTNDAFSLAASVQSQLAKQSALNYQRASGEQIHQATNQLFSLSDSLAKGEGLTELFGGARSAQVQKNFQDSLDAVKHFAKENGISIEKAFTVGMNAMAGLKRPDGALHKIFNLGISGTGGASAHTQDRDLIQKFEKSGHSKVFSESLSRGIQHMEEVKGSNFQNRNVQSLNQIQESFSKAKTYSEQAQASLNDSHSWSQSASTHRQRGIQSNSNINDQVLQQVANQRFGGSVQTAAQWQAAHPQAYLKEAESFLQKRSQGYAQQAVNEGMKSVDDVNHTYAKQSQKISSALTGDNLDRLKDQASKTLNEHTFLTKKDTLKAFIKQELEKMAQTIKPETLKSDMSLYEQEMKEAKEKTMIKKVWNKVIE